MCAPLTLARTRPCACGRPDPAVNPIPCPTNRRSADARLPCAAEEITQTPIVLDEFGFTFLDLDSWKNGYQEVITIKQSLLDPAKPYQFYKDGVRMEMTAQEFLAMTVSQSGWAIEGWVAGDVAGDLDLFDVVKDEVIEANVILSTLKPYIKLEIRLAYIHGGYY